MNYWSQYKALFLKEMKSEWRSKTSISSIVLYLVSTLFVIFMAFKKIQSPQVWNALFWIVFLFTIVQSAIQLFAREKPEEKLWYYTILKPNQILFSKVAFHLLMVFFMALLNLGLYQVIVGIDILPKANWELFLLTLLVGGAVLSVSFVLVTAIASQTSNGMGLVAILGFPIILPALMLMITVGMQALQGVTLSFVVVEIGALALLLVLVLAMSFLLFPLLWKD